MRWRKEQRRAERGYHQTSMNDVAARAGVSRDTLRQQYGDKQGMFIAAHDWLLERLPDPGDYVVVASILRDKDADGILDRLARAGRTLVATTSSSPRALPAGEVSALARPRFSTVETVADPHHALARARQLGRPVLVTGSLYLLADLAGDQ